MQIVIDISKEVYNHVLKAKSIPDMLGIDILNVINAVKNGTPLPKEYGRLVDGSRIEQHLQQKLLKYGKFPQYKQGLEMALNDVVKIASTIIEADKGE